ncbi:UTRA domain-containing protein [Gordonia oryzae]|uniref:UTRA domain-containing protein n=1 Tax=Gordonia oryzae TaxID=2487349 RepID=UPI00319EA1C3
MVSRDDARRRSLRATGQCCASTTLTSPRVRRSATDTPVDRLTRLRIVDDEPLALETAHLPGEFDDFAHDVAPNSSLCATLRTRRNVICDR